MTTSRRPQQRYDHRLRDLVHNMGNVTFATDLGVPRSTARGWLRKAPRVAVTMDVTNVKTLELQQEVLELRRRVKLEALLRLALALLRSSGFTLTYERLPDGRDKTRILRAVDRARDFVPLRALLRFLRLSPSRFHTWRRLQDACALDDQASCPHRSPHRLTPPEVLAIKDMVTAPEYRHVPTGGSPFWRSASAGSGHRPRPGITWYASTAGGGPGSACTRPSRKSACERLEPTRCGTSTPPSSACSTGVAPICTR
jgi:putative transposase